ncbi:MAG: 4-(cytidine 5'-diphospho)-2-C-methyl-D-erythritol kinase [Actinobacteria bacterium]|uniref:4-(cytidine 5'-diphospho)-2-C-methyl-D-erythritol kinase n=1 Tax=freshwater metagenome TaxID=449393 RepID=A0A6J6ECF3_9ZZZZ|nr:4-(cytidine 5'-diphospho)-2-C-methyl-D-erythritol kinase [Actinomycetota bacterium]MTA33093.1 4-(cytidine 5'-diphospho)-2-C-methyl-D-erythritol kinase [Actinomycetota bacterium]
MPFSHLPDSSVIARAPGKINLALRVGPRRADGYHDLLTCFQAVDIWETVALSPADEFSIAVSGDVNLGEIPLDGNNLAMKAVAAVARATGRADAVAILIDKKVPVGGGMGGGSADAAATLIAINELWQTGLSQVELLTIAAELGSDVPFLLEGGTAIGRGRGEILEPIKSLAFSWVIVPSMEHLATPGVYGRLDELRADVDVVLPESLPDAFLDALYRGDPEALAPHLINDMAQASLDLEPELEATLEKGLQCGALAVMVSGSGPTCAMLARDDAHANAMQASLRDQGHHCVVTSSPARGAHLVRR